MTEQQMPRDKFKAKPSDWESLSSEEGTYPTNTPLPGRCKYVGGTARLEGPGTKTNTGLMASDTGRGIHREM